MLNVEKSLSLEKLTRTNWAFGQSGYAPMSTCFRFDSNGHISGYRHPNESAWEFKDGSLRIFTADGAVMWQSDHLYVENGGLRIVLKCPTATDTEFTVSECTADGRLGYSGDKGLSASEFLFPTDLRVTPTGVTKVLMVGSCLTELYHRTFVQKYADVGFDYILFNSAGDLPAEPPSPLSSYDFQYLQLPLRTVVTDRIITGGRLQDPTFLDVIFSDGCSIIDVMLEAGLAYNRSHGILTLVSNFLVPQMDASTHIAGRYRAQDLAMLTRRLNEYLASAIARFRNVFLCDVDALASSLGKRYFLDDVTGFYSHGSNIQQDGVDLEPMARIEPVPPVADFYPTRAEEFLTAIYDQAVTTYRIVKQIDQVKAVVFDLDNTLWRGQIAEDYRPERAPWPRGGLQNGIWESIQHLRARGILVAICSKNDLDVVKTHWDNVVEPAFIKLDDFASLKINWKSKAENIIDICREFNVKPKSVVFVDDNPVERGAVQQALPGIRVIGSNPYLTRRILLWAPETQIVHLTDETSKREGSIRNQIMREQTRVAVSRPEFLASLNSKLDFFEVDDAEHADLPRVLELTNKTNQFNTSGVRWSHPELVSFIARGGRVSAFRVSDKFSEYGLVGVLFSERCEILQFVMSCRVMGMDIEHAALAKVVASIRGNEGARQAIGATLRVTADNSPCRDVFANAGFSRESTHSDLLTFRLKPEKSVTTPSHILINGTPGREIDGYGSAPIRSKAPASTPIALVHRIFRGRQ